MAGYVGAADSIFMGGRGYGYGGGDCGYGGGGLLGTLLAVSLLGRGGFGFGHDGHHGGHGGHGCGCCFSPASCSDVLGVSEHSADRDLSICEGEKHDLVNILNGQKCDVEKSCGRDMALAESEKRDVLMLCETEKKDIICEINKRCEGDEKLLCKIQEVAIMNEKERLEDFKYNDKKFSDLNDKICKETRDRLEDTIVQLRAELATAAAA